MAFLSLRNLWCFICNYTRKLLLPHLIHRAQYLYPSIGLGNVLRITSKTVLKTSTAFSIALEVENTRFICENTTIPVPRVYDTWTDKRSGKGYLVMDYIPGETLASVWKKITPEQKRTVMRTLGGYIKQLRAIRQPPLPSSKSGWIGSAKGNQGYDMRISSSEAWGPFQSEREYNDWRISRLTLSGQITQKMAVRLRQIRQEMRDDHRICFTHGDITNGNVLVRVDGEGPEDISIVGLIDWEQAGWRPEYWEKVKLFYVMGCFAEWCTLVREEIESDYEGDLQREFELSLLSRAVL